jgi:hypothetical protein
MAQVIEQLPSMSVVLSSNPTKAKQTKGRGVAQFNRAFAWHMQGPGFKPKNHKKKIKENL